MKSGSLSGNSKAYKRVFHTSLDMPCGAERSNINIVFIICSKKSEQKHY